MIFSPSKIAFFDPNPDMKARYEAAGAWPADGVEVTVDVWQQYIDTPPSGKMLGAVNGLPAWVDVPAPAPKTQFTPLEFQARIPADKLHAIVQAAVSNPALLLLLFQFAGAGIVDITDQRTISGVNAFVAAGVLTQADAQEILAP